MLAKAACPMSLPPSPSELSVENRHQLEQSADDNITQERRPVEARRVLRRIEDVDVHSLVLTRYH